jgi:glycosyltransferase involved in cell wall biosynthesis
MKVALLNRHQEHFSLRIYRENIVQELCELGIQVAFFTESGPIPRKCDLVWDPGLGMRGIPGILRKTDFPVICTIHGLRAFYLPISELAKSLKELIYEYFMKLKVTRDWSWFYKKVSAVIAVSEFGAMEIVNAFKLPHDIIYSIHHGVDHSIFKPYEEKQNLGYPYLLHISSYHPKKNVDRVFAAYTILPESRRPDLIAILPGYHSNTNIKNIKIIRDGLLPTELAKWYRSALGFVFPSLHETFGMPILEAMACGCPVITSHNTGCAEIAGDAALLVNPRSVDDISDKMKHLIGDEALRKSLRQKGMIRAQKFTWKKSAEEHLKVFEKVLKERSCIQRHGRQ